MQTDVFIVYVLRNLAGRFYVGQTQDAAVRLASHNQEGPSEGKYTRKSGPWVMVYQEAYATRDEAMRREREIKAWKSAERIRGLIGEGQSPAKRD